MAIVDGPLLVLAGAGSGKTRVITTRIAHLLSLGIPASAILAMTFTNRAAGEMKQRVAKAVKSLSPSRASARDPLAALSVGTFHWFCLRLLRQHAAAVGFAGGFTIADASDQLALVKSVLRELRIGETTIQPSLALSRISLAKNRLESPDSYAESATNEKESLVHGVWVRYQEALTRQRAVDFDDLLLLTLALFSREPSILQDLRQTYRYVMVDEYQDTNVPQYEILRQLSGKKKNLCVVGDDDQSIYGWRGADVRKILNFQRDFKGARVVRLETNYRSSLEILEAANNVIAHNPSRHDKRLVSARGSGAPVRMVRFSDELVEAQEIAKEIRLACTRKQATLKDYAILFRTQVQPRVFETELRASGIPYRLVGGMSYFDRKEVRDVLAFLKWAQNPDDESSLLRIINTPPRGLGKTTVQRAIELATERAQTLHALLRDPDDEVRDILGVKSPAIYAELRRLVDSFGLPEVGRELPERIQSLVEAVGYRLELKRLYPDPMTREGRWAAVAEVFNLAENHCRKNRKPSLTAFLDELALTTQDDKKSDEPDRDVVTLMTLHSAKGLEFPRVYLVGMEEGILPHVRSVEDSGVEEERRLAYVGITRAQDHLCLSFVSSRAKYGKRVECTPSRFLFELRGKQPPEDWEAVEDRIARERADSPQPAEPGEAIEVAEAKESVAPSGRKSAAKKRSVRASTRGSSSVRKK